MNYKELEQKIINAYTEGVTLDDAEKLAGEFLEAQIKASEEIKQLDLNARLLKSLVKQTRAEVFVTEATTPEKKPSDTLLSAMVDKNQKVQHEQGTLDLAEVDRDEILRMFNIFKDAHIFYRGVSRGKFE